MEHKNNKQSNPELKNKIVELTPYLELTGQFPKDENCEEQALRFIISR